MSSSSSSHKKKIVVPEMDPYAVLGLEVGATDSAVTKAYRKGALKYHPDKQRVTATAAADAQGMAIKFQQLQQARAFLLDAEFRASRVVYDTLQTSRAARARYEKQRTSQQHESRKRRVDELATAEADAQQKKTAKSTSCSTQQQQGLRRQGAELREKKAQADAAAAQQAAQQATETTTETLASRQVRLKWSRQRMETSPSEESLAKLLGDDFGRVSLVEFLGTKGNAALVTFARARSVALCVRAYQSSSVMRATALATTPPSLASTTTTTPVTTTTTTTKSARDYESVEEWQARRAAAAQALLLDEEEQGETKGDNDDTTQSQSSKAAAAATTTTTTVSIDSFLPPLPRGGATSTPWERLEVLEAAILGAVWTAAAR
jgi:curved DNA-binding protein CbpA